MADVLIRGIEMPCNVEGCEVIIRIQPNGEVLDAHKIHIGATAIPLPEGHGRLIDADAPIEVWDMGEDGAPHIVKTTVSRLILGHLTGAVPPTVIEAEVDDD